MTPSLKIKNKGVINMTKETRTYMGTFIIFLRDDEQTTQEVINKLVDLGIDINLIEVVNNEILIEIPDTDDDVSVGCSLDEIREAVRPAIVQMFAEYLNETEYDWSTIDVHKERIYL